MIPLLIAAGASAAIASLVAYLRESGAAAEAQAIIKTAQDKYGTISPPALEKAAKDVLGPSKFQSIVENPAYAQAQGDALAALKTVSDAGGLTAADRANLNAIQTQANNTANSREQNVLESFRNRGAGGSGAALAASLGAGQDAANRQMQAGLDIAGQAQRNALDATMRRGQLASQFSAQDWQRQSDRARADDEINRANWGRRYDTIGQNNNVAMNQYQAALTNQRQQMGYAQQNANAAREQGERDSRLIQQIGQSATGAFAGGAKGALPTGGAESVATAASPMTTATASPSASGTDWSVPRPATVTDMDPDDWWRS